MKKIRIANDTDQQFYLSIEPIAEGYALAPNETIELIGTFDLQRENEVAIVLGQDEGMTISVWAPEDTLVLKNGIKIGPP